LTTASKKEGKEKHLPSIYQRPVEEIENLKILLQNFSLLLREFYRCTAAATTLPSCPAGTGLGVSWRTLGVQSLAATISWQQPLILSILKKNKTGPRAFYKIKCTFYRFISAAL
jgi:hypothetical protein